jgi:hypothetical protein
MFLFICNKSLKSQMYVIYGFITIFLYLESSINIMF